MSKESYYIHLKKFLNRRSKSRVKRSIIGDVVIVELCDFNSVLYTLDKLHDELEDLKFSISDYQLLILKLKDIITYE